MCLGLWKSLFQNGVFFASISFSNACVDGGSSAAAAKVVVAASGSVGSGFGSLGSGRGSEDEGSVSAVPGSRIGSAGVVPGDGSPGREMEGIVLSVGAVAVSGAVPVIVDISNLLFLGVGRVETWWNLGMMISWQADSVYKGFFGLGRSLSRFSIEYLPGYGRRWKLQVSGTTARPTEGIAFCNPSRLVYVWAHVITTHYSCSREMGLQWD